MVFQDFDILQERRRQERQRKLKKRIGVVVVVILVIVCIAAATAFAFSSMQDDTNSAAKKSDNDGTKDYDKPNDDKPTSTPPPSPKPSPPPSKQKPKQSPESAPSPAPEGQVASKEFVQSICDGSTYKRLCATTLTKNLEKNPDSVEQPKQLVKSFITSTNDALDKALTKVKSIELKTELDKKAFGVCQELMGDAKEELQSTGDKVEKIDPTKLPTNGDLTSQLSAVMSYQEACVDGFSEGQTKNDFITTFNTSQVYTSNSLAMVRQLAKLMKLGNKNNSNNNNNDDDNNKNNNDDNDNKNNNNKKDDNNNNKKDDNNNDNKNNNDDDNNNKNNDDNNNNNIKKDDNNNNNDNKNNNNNDDDNNNKKNNDDNDNNNNKNNNKTQGNRRLLQTEFLNRLNREQQRLLKEEGGDEKSKKPTPNVTVAQDGSGQFKTISEALAAMPEKHDGRYVIFVKAGTYEENVNVTKKMVNLTIYGEGSKKSIITGSKNTADGIPRYLTASFVASGRGFMAKAMGFRNTAGPNKQQALAARISSDRSIFVNCRFEGYQNTLYVQTHRQFYRGCAITGTKDFIFGDAAAVFQNCEIYVKKPNDDNQTNTITAQTRRDNFETTGIVIQNSKIMPDESFKQDANKFKNYLGRPTKRYSRTVIMQTQIDDFIDPSGWLQFEGQNDFAIETLFFGEFNNSGSGAKTENRVKWAGRKDINKDEAMNFTVRTFLKGSWVKEAGVSVRMELGS